MVEQRLSVIHKAGLHMHTAAMLAQALKPFQATVTVHTHDKQVNARSITRLISLGATQGTELLIQADGPDEQAALTAAVQVFATDLS
jgi:phosphotransferase system HPr (HPr) family protein